VWALELPAPASLDLSRAEFQQRFSQTAGINYNTDAFGTAINGLLGFLGVTTLPPEAQDVIDFVGDLVPIQGSLRLGPTFTFDAGVYIQANELTNSQVAIAYPVNVEVEFPQPNTFGCGDEFVIHTSYVVDGAPTLDVAPPFTDLEFGPILSDIDVSLSLEANIDVCIPGGDDAADFLESVGELFTDDQIELGEGCVDVFDFNQTLLLNNISINSRKEDMYINAIQLCKAGNKLFNDWYSLETTKKLITDLKKEITNDDVHLDYDNKQIREFTENKILELCY
jgi:hypothetical protein